MAPHPSMLTVDASTSDRARFIGFSIFLHFVVLDIE
jgi:hypothetical protein